MLLRRFGHSGCRRLDLGGGPEGGVCRRHQNSVGQGQGFGSFGGIVERMNRETRALLTDPDIRARFAELGGTPGDLSAEGYTEFVRREVALWAPLVQASGATVD